jgi:hypothetical protein
MNAKLDIQNWFRICYIISNKKIKKEKDMGMGYLILAGAIMLFSWLVSSRLKSNLNIIRNCIYKTECRGAEIKLRRC